MDPATISTLVALATQITGLAVKYNDPDSKAPTVEAVAAHLEEFKKLNPLPEQVDEGFVGNIMGQINDFINGIGK